MTEPSKRRPIASRDWNVSRRLAGWLAARNVSPNAISVAGMLAGALSGACFALTSHVGDFARGLWLAGAFFAQLRLVANMLDGMVAVQTDRCSPVGELYNEVPDRVSDTAIFVGLGYAAGGSPVLGFAAALAAMSTAYMRTTCVTAGAPPNFHGPLAKQHRMFLVTCLALASTVLPSRWLAFDHEDVSITATRLTLWLTIFGSVLTAMRRLVESAATLRAGAKK